MNSILEVHKLSKQYGSFTALSNVSLTVQPGEIISVLGPSGCGKSTLLQLIAGLAQPDTGEILLRGDIVSSAKRLVPPEKRGINMVFQDYALWPHMTIEENIVYGMRNKKFSQTERSRKLKELVSLLQLEGLETRLPPQLSGGQQQRVAIARALATEPDLLLLDEPLSNLDMRLRIKMRTEMAYLFRSLGTTVFHVTHDPDEAFALADRMIIMRSGAIDQMDQTQVCYQKPATPSVASLLGAGNRLRGRFAGTIEKPAIQIHDVIINGILPSQEIEPSAETELLIRPDDIGWQSESTNQLPVQIIHCAFEGSRWRLLAELADGQKIIFMHSDFIEPGTSGTVSLSTNSAYLYPYQDER